MQKLRANIQLVKHIVSVPSIRFTIYAEKATEFPLTAPLYFCKLFKLSNTLPPRTRVFL